MLLELNIKNYKSFKDRASLDMTAAEDVHEHESFVFNQGDVRVLPMGLMQAENLIFLQLLAQCEMRSWDILNPILYIRILRGLSLIQNQQMNQQNLRFQYYLEIQNTDTVSAEIRIKYLMSGCLKKTA